jgi:hypothetical protein
MIDAVERDGDWVPMVDGVAQSKLFGCKMSALGYAKAVETDVAEPERRMGPCTIRRGVWCAGILAMELLS